MEEHLIIPSKLVLLSIACIFSPLLERCPFSDPFCFVLPENVCLFLVFKSWSFCHNTGLLLCIALLHVSISLPLFFYICFKVCLICLLWFVCLLLVCYYLFCSVYLKSSSFACPAILARPVMWILTFHLDCVWIGFRQLIELLMFPE